MADSPAKPTVLLADIGGTNSRLTSVPRTIPARGLVVGVAQGTGKILPILAALRGRVVNGLITNETTARSVLDLG